MMIRKVMLEEEINRLTPKPDLSSERNAAVIGVTVMMMVMRHW